MKENDEPSVGIGYWIAVVFTLTAGIGFVFGAPHAVGWMMIGGLVAAIAISEWAKRR